MIGVVEALVEVLINSSSEYSQGWTVDQVGGRSFHSLKVDKMPANKHICHASGIYRDIPGNTGK